MDPTDPHPEHCLQEAKGKLFRKKEKFPGTGDVNKEPPYLHASSGKSAQGGLGSGSRGLGPVTTSGPQLDVQGRYAQGFHCSVVRTIF
jgi:hypothetical protein